MNYACRAFGVGNFGDLDMLAPDEIRTALRHWMITVAIRHMHDDSCCLTAEIHYALEHYFSSAIYFQYTESYIDHVVNEMVRYYNRFFAYIVRYHIIHYDITTPYHEGVFLVTRDP